MAPSMEGNQKWNSTYEGDDSCPTPPAMEGSRCSFTMAFWMAWIVVIITMDAAVQLTAGLPSGAGHPKHTRPHEDGDHTSYGHKELHQQLRGIRYSSTHDPQYYRDECRSQSLACVPKDDCVARTPGGYPEGRVCPINFVPHDSLCVLFAFKKKVEPRTQAQVVDYCRRLRSRPYYFQSAKEWREFYGFVNQKAANYYELFMLDARWEKDHDRWEWLSTGEAIEWEKLLPQANCSEENRKVVRKEDGCLGFSLDRESKCLRLRLVKCTDTALPFFCKDGSYESRCGQNQDSLCCASPTYSYYSKNKYGGPGTTGIHGPSKRDCWVKVNYPDIRPVTCHKGLDILGTLTPFPQPVRVGRSYYYFSHNPCRVSRQAVVSGMQVHDFIASYMLTEEMVVGEKSYIIGLKYKPDDDSFFWEDGKPIDYYNNETFWAHGQPDKQSGTNVYSCVAYKSSGKNNYAWHLLPHELCAGPGTVNVCEMTIRSTNLIPSAKKRECGQRLERGVLARSLYGDVGYDEEEAQYGEFPWHVAVLQPSTYKDGVVMVFACSGVLIHPEYVLTSAHCVIYSGNGDFSVSFGEWNLNDDSGQILDTKLVTVSDVIIHPDYKSTSVMHDMALLQLQEKVDVHSYPHIGLGCLPYPRVFYQASRAWNCYTVGWPATKRRVDRLPQKTHERILQRIESNFISSSHCRRYTNAYYDKARQYRREAAAYDKEYGAHHLNYEQHGYFENRIVDLICTEPYETHSCLDDDTPILVCKKASIFSDDPFGTYTGNLHYGPGDRYDHFGPDYYYGPGDGYYRPGAGYGSSDKHGPHDPHRSEDDHHRPGNKYGPSTPHNEAHGGHGPTDPHNGPREHYGRSYGRPLNDDLLWNSRIINSFGDDRFDSDKWYVMGIGHNLNSCDVYYEKDKVGEHRAPRRRPHQVFTPVHEYLSFIHSHLEPQHTGPTQEAPVSVLY